MAHQPVSGLRPRSLKQAALHDQMSRSSSGVIQRGHDGDRGWDSGINKNLSRWTNFISSMAFWKGQKHIRS